jgi:DNA polymerase I-like protein with 3'-5' exonuclease and polymerase domains
MVTTTVLVDTTFLFDKTSKAFLGAEILKRGDEDVTFAFGFLRDVLRLRQKLLVQRGLLVVGKDAYRVAAKNEILLIVELLTELGLPLQHEPTMRALDIANSLSPQTTHLVTHNKAFLQLATDSLHILLPKGSDDYVAVSGDTVKSYLGVTDVPTFLTLIRAARVTKRQAIRLVELHGNLDQLYENIREITSSALRAKLAENEKHIREVYTGLQLGGQGAERGREPIRLPDLTLRLDNQRARDTLSSYGFHSLVRLLKLELPRELDSPLTELFSDGRKQRKDYRPIVDHAGLRELERKVLSARICAVDTESDGKDPRRAALLGVSFAVERGAAYFVPFLDKDLRDVSRDGVAKSLRKILGSAIKFVGHNIKYDYILLLRNNLRINTIHFDTMLAAYECYGDWDFFNLSYLGEKLINRKIKPYKEVVDKDQSFLDLPFTEIVEHACEDADITLQLHDFLHKELEKKEIETQYFADTMSRMRKLGDLEHRGVRTSTRRLEKIRATLALEANRLKKLALNEIGTVFDLDSPSALDFIVRDAMKLKGLIGTKKISPAVLEQLAINNPGLQLVVKYKRMTKRLAAVEAIVKCVDRNKVHPVFNQIRSTYGALASKNPNLFDVEGISGLRDAFSKEIQPYFRDEGKALDALQEMAEDKVLREDRKSDDRGNGFLAAHTLTASLERQEQDELVLLLALDRADFDLSKRFFLNRLAASTVRHDVQIRYRSTFRFLDEFRRNSLTQGYAFGDGQRKYLAGLKSSNLGKRKKAQEYAVRWLLGY